MALDFTESRAISLYAARLSESLGRGNSRAQLQNLPCQPRQPQDMVGQFLRQSLGVAAAFAHEATYVRFIKLCGRRGRWVHPAS